mgnify:CR=1 FL=1
MNNEKIDDEIKNIASNVREACIQFLEAYDTVEKYEDALIKNLIDRGLLKKGGYLDISLDYSDGNSMCVERNYGCGPDQEYFSWTVFTDPEEYDRLQAEAEQKAKELKEQQEKQAEQRRIESDRQLFERLREKYGW